MNTTSHSSSDKTPSTIEGRLEKLLMTEGCMRQMHQSGMRRQKEFVKRVREALQSDQKDILGAICKHLAQKGKVQSALSYIKMYVNTEDMSPETLAYAFHHIMMNIYDKNRIDDRKDPRLATPPKGLFSVMQKLEKNCTEDVDGTISLIQGKVSQIFAGDIDRAISQYRLALEKKHPDSCYLLGIALAEKDLYTEGSEMFLRGWTEFEHLDSLAEYIRLSFFLGNDFEAIKYYDILKMIKKDVPHIFEYIPVLSFPQRLPLLLDYIRKHHVYEYLNPIDPQIYQHAIYWIRSRLIELNKEQATITETMIQLEEKGLDTIEIKIKKRGVILELLEMMEIGAVYLLDTTITAQYLENILALLKGHSLGRELLTEHILASESYARKWMEGRSMQIIDMDDIEVDEETGEITRRHVGGVSGNTSSMLAPRDDSPEQLIDDGTQSIGDDIMGVVDMILYHSMTYHDGDISELYVKIAEEILDNPEIFQRDKVHMDAIIEKSVFDDMPKSLRDWYEKLEEAIDDGYSPFVRKKIQGAHRSDDSARISGAKDILLFLVFDGFLSDFEEERIDAYIENLAGFDLTYPEGLNLATLCMHFGNHELAFELLCDGIADWSNTQTLILSLHLLAQITGGETELAEKMVKQMEISIRKQGYEIEDFEEFLNSSINWQFSENEHPQDEGLLYQLSGLGALLYGDKEMAIEYFTKAYSRGNLSALLDRAMLYSWYMDHEGAYTSRKTVYDSDTMEYARELPRLAELAIVTGHRDEVPEYLRTMKAKNIEGSSWICFYLNITGDRSEEIQAIRSLGVYGKNIPEAFDPAIMNMAGDRMVAIRDDGEATHYERLSCQRELALLESEGQSQAISYWQMLEKLVIEGDFQALSEHLTTFIDARIQDVYGMKTNDTNRKYEQSRIGLVSEVLVFRRERAKDKDFIFLFDLMFRICSVFPENANLMKDWREEIQGTMTSQQAFELGYDFGKFGKKATLH